MLEARNSDQTAASALKSSPLWNLMPFFRVKRQVVASFCSHLSASIGTTSIVLESRSVSSSYMFLVTTRIALSSANCASRFSGSVLTTMVSFPLAADAAAAAVGVTGGRVGLAATAGAAVGD